MLSRDAERLSTVPGGHRIGAVPEHGAGDLGDPPGVLRPELIEHALHGEWFSPSQGTHLVGIGPGEQSSLSTTSAASSRRCRANGSALSGFRRRNGVLTHAGETNAAAVIAIAGRRARDQIIFRLHRSQNAGHGRQALAWPQGRVPRRAPRSTCERGPAVIPPLSRVSAIGQQRAQNGARVAEDRRAEEVRSCRRRARPRRCRRQHRC